MSLFLVKTPPGLRKSGIPDSVSWPAPAKTTARLLSAIIDRSCSIFFSFSTITCSPSNFKKVFGYLGPNSYLTQRRKARKEKLKSSLRNYLGVFAPHARHASKARRAGLRENFFVPV
jgi:hypothetical protein